LKSVDYVSEYIVLILAENLGILEIAMIFPADLKFDSNVFHFGDGGWNHYADLLLDCGS